MKFKSNYVEQLDETDCGAAALGMILKFYKSNISLALLRKYAQTDKKGTTALGIVRAAEHFELDTKAIQYDPTLLEQIHEDFKFPFIAHINKGKGLLHYVVVIRCKDHKVLIADPDSKVKITNLSFDNFKAIWSGVALIMWPSNHYQKQLLAPTSLLKTAKILLPQKFLILGIIITMTLSTLITIGGTVYLEKIIDEFIPRHEVNRLSILGLGLVTAYVFHGMLNCIEGFWSAILSKKLSRQILSDYLNHLLRLPISFFDARQSGELTSRFSDANNIISALASTAITTILNIGTIIIISIVLFLINIRLFAISLIIIPIYTTIIFLFAPKFNKWNNDRMEKNATVSSQIIEDLHGIETIKSLSVESTIFTTFNKNFSKLLNSDFMYNLLNVVQESLKDTIELVINLLILYLGAMLVLKNTISLGELVAFTTLFNYFLDPIQELINLQDEIQTASVANNRIEEIMAVPTENLGTVQKLLTMPTRNNKIIQFENVVFEYKYGQTILNNINLEINRNQSTAIIGLSGSGKTTLAKLLIDFYKPNKGHITINDHDISKFNRHTLRTYIVYLSQSPHTFTGSIFENITLGKSNSASLKEVIWAAKIAEIDNDIMEMPEQYNTQLTEDSGLSGGQLQRIAIARTVFNHPQIMVLDESTSNLDLETEKQILINIRQLKNITTIFIAHRLQVTTQADNIVVMKNGSIVETGSRKQLEQQKGTYYSLISDFKNIKRKIQHFIKIN